MCCDRQVLSDFGLKLTRREVRDVVIELAASDADHVSVEEFREAVSPKCLGPIIGQKSAECTNLRTDLLKLKLTLDMRPTSRWLRECMWACGDSWKSDAVSSTRSSCC